MNDGLIIAGVILGVFIILLGLIITVRLSVQMLKKQNSTDKADKFIGLIFGGIMIVIGAYISLLEYNFLTNFEYVDGTINNYCGTDNNRNKKVEFEYTFEGKRYINCTTYPPELKNKIEVPGGKYQVRVSSFKPDGGRMDFDKPIIQTQD